MEHKKILNDVLIKPPEGSLVVFDLDSTLFNVSPRTYRILRHFIEHPENRTQFKEIDQLLNVSIEPTDWGLRQAIERANLKASEEMFKALRKHWKKHFFSNHFLHHDVPYPGAVEFVNELAKRGHAIVYLTGRDRLNMHTGTVEGLQAHQFPLQTDNQLIMKAYKGASEDEDFKVLELKKILPQYETITFFENEPVILNRVHDNLPDIQLIWVDTTHSGREEAPRVLPKIKGSYLVD